MSLSNIRQRGLIVVAMLAMLVSLAAIILVAQASRFSVSQTETMDRVRLQEWLESAKYSLIPNALAEDSTPGTFRCPETASCAASTPIGTPSFEAVSMPYATPPGICLVQVVAPSARNTLLASWRDDSPSQKRINPTFSSDLKMIDSRGTVSYPWAVLLARSGIATCNLTNLGFSAAFDPVSGALTLTESSDGSAVRVAIERRDIVSPLYGRILETVDVTPIEMYLAMFSGSTAVPLSSVRNALPEAFDIAIAGTSSLTDPVPATGCRGVEVTAAVTPPTIPPTSVTTIKYKEPVSWLCYNDWYSHITYLPSTKTFQISDPSTGMICSRPHAGKTTCT